jgi:uncharacterized protein YciI
MQTYVLEIRFDKDEERRMAVRPAHREFLTRLYEDGVLLMAGPLADGSGALQVLRAEDLDDLEAILADDPNVVEDVVTQVSLRAWDPFLPPAELMG